MSEQGVGLSDIISKLEQTKINELWKVVNNLRSLSTEINGFVKRERGVFAIIYNSDIMELRIHGRYSDCLYYLTNIDEHKTLAEIYSKFFDDVNTFYRNMLNCLNSEIKDFVNIVENHLPQDDP